MKTDAIFDNMALNFEKARTDLKMSDIKDSSFKKILGKTVERSAESSVKSGKVLSENIPLKKKVIDQKLMNVSIEMESLFVGRMLKEMRNTIPKSKLIDGGMAEKIFEDMLYDEYSLNLSKTAGLGLAGMIYNELSR